MDLQRMQKVGRGEAFTRNHEEKIEIDRKRRLKRYTRMRICWLQFLVLFYFIVSYA
jgi:hypothetical protein